MKDNLPEINGVFCPLPLQHDDRIVMGHGSGGKMAHNLIKKHFIPAFSNPILSASDDAGIIDIPEGSRLAISTDSHVVYPLFFPGGDIGRLAVCGTVNDVAMMGATPKYLTAGFILEEGLEIQILTRIIQSMKDSAQEAGVQIIAGDTKVVQRGKVDGLFINSTGVGLIPDGVNIGGASAQPGDRVILSGTIGDHGIAVLGARGELGLEVDVRSDVAPLNNLVKTLLECTIDIHVLRDPTRGGLATSLNEIAIQSNLGIKISEDLVPVKPSVAAACELLGFDPFYIANEGKLIVIVPENVSTQVLISMRNHPLGTHAQIIGEVSAKYPGRVLLQTNLGSTRVLDMLSGEILPRIC